MNNFYFVFFWNIKTKKGLDEQISRRCSTIIVNHNKINIFTTHPGPYNNLNTPEIKNMFSTITDKSKNSNKSEISNALIDSSIQVENKQCHMNQQIKKKEGAPQLLQNNFINQLNYTQQIQKSLNKNSLDYKKAFYHKKGNFSLY